MFSAIVVDNDNEGVFDRFLLMVCRTKHWDEELLVLPISPSSSPIMSFSVQVVVLKLFGGREERSGGIRFFSVCASVAT